jgi:hypothetical protein
MPLGIEFRAQPDLLVLAVTTSLAVLATVGSGLGPALKISRTNLVDDLKTAVAGASPAPHRRLSARNILVVGQIALSLMLLSAGGLFARGALKAAAANPAVERVGGEARPDRAQQVSATYRIIGADYFQTLNLPMVRGREFSRAEEESRTAPAVAIVDERLARTLFGADDPIGRTIRFIQRHDSMDASPERQAMEIVGVAAPIRDELFDRDAGPAIYVPYGRNYRAMVSIHARAAQPGAEAGVLAAIRRELRAMDARLPIVNATTMTAFHERGLMLWTIRAGGRMFLALGGLALLLAVVGLYGVKAYLVTERTREIGIRMALGARPGDVMAMVMREGAALSAAGVALGLPLAALLGVALGSLLYDVKPIDPVVFSFAPAILALAALTATWLPARRATRITPLTALRTD